MSEFDAKIAKIKGTFGFVSHLSYDLSILGDDVSVEDRRILSGCLSDLAIIEDRLDDNKVLRNDWSIVMLNKSIVLGIADKYKVKY